MNLTNNDLIHLPVETQSGQHLGRISSFEIDLENQSIIRYYVKTGLIKGLWHQELIIAKNQVISVDSEKMIVEDNLSLGEKAVKKVSFVTPTTK